MADEPEMTIVTLAFDAADAGALVGVLSKYVVLTRMEQGCRNVDLCASVTTPGPLRRHREVGVGRGPTGALRLARSWSTWPGRAPAC